MIQTTNRLSTAAPSPIEQKCLMSSKKCKSSVEIPAPPSTLGIKVQHTSTAPATVLRVNARPVPAASNPANRFEGCLISMMRLEVSTSQR